LYDSTVSSPIENLYDPDFFLNDAASHPQSSPAYHPDYPIIDSPFSPRGDELEYDPDHPYFSSPQHQDLAKQNETMIPIDPLFDNEYDPDDPMSR
jgi:hypothetical protein